MFALRVLLMLVVTGGRYGTRPVQLRMILDEDSLRVSDNEIAMWNDPYFDRIFGVESSREQREAPDSEQGEDESLEEKSEDENAETEEFKDAESFTDAEIEQSDKDEEEEGLRERYNSVRSPDELPYCDETTTESSSPQEYVDYDSPAGGGEKSSGAGRHIRGFILSAGIVASSCFVFLFA